MAHCHNSIAEIKWNSFQRSEQPTEEQITQLKEPLTSQKKQLDTIEELPFSIIQAGTFAGSYSKYKCRIHQQENLTGDHMRQAHRLPNDDRPETTFLQLIKNAFANPNSQSTYSLAEILKKYKEKRKELILSPNSPESNSPNPHLADITAPTELPHSSAQSRQAPPQASSSPQI